MRYAHSLIDPRMGQHFVWGMGPGTIADAKSYLALLAQLLPRARHPSLDARSPDRRAGAGRFPIARVASEASAGEAVHHSSQCAGGRIGCHGRTIRQLPLGDRMQAEVQLAYLDYAHSRFGQAIERFLKALAFFQWAEIPVMEGLVICGLGAIARRQANLQEAQHWYECAVVPAAKDGNPVLMSTIVENLAAIAFEEKRFADAEERYSELVVLKRAMIDEDGVADALEWQGLSQEGQLAYDRAVECWYESALICKAFEMTDRLPRVLDHLKRGYQELEMRAELEQFEAEWA